MSINNDNEFMEHCESGLLVVSFKKDNVIGMPSSSWKAIHSEEPFLVLSPKKMQ